MTFIEQPRLDQVHPASVRLGIFLSNWGRKRRRRKRNRLYLSQLPDRLLRDVGLEHLIELKPEPLSLYRLR